eukprot:CAMPEP_0182851660 /NCGR_PEP_ID=MMETSP0006_2-20121128/30742_1 /TAXON_ID=97485 /ORGANISM="Prymnesium parvum, Strain Texoma1" /LENGTH=151 /DNA_ID=CAMNT_0024982339 /DNA_START=60 /DNA_END=515 /DNA_ORIENTATION=+
MTTVIENMQISETLRREDKSRKDWAKQNASGALIYDPESTKSKRLNELKEQVADLCDLQPTPAAMVRPPRKEMLSGLRDDLVKALTDVESELENIGGSVTQASVKSHTTVKSAATAKSARQRSLRQQRSLRRQLSLRRQRSLRQLLKLRRP